jgi:hypothetical protein
VSCCRPCSQSQLLAFFPLAVNSGCTARVRQGVQQVPYCMARLSSELLRAVTDALTLFSHALATWGDKGKRQGQESKRPASGLCCSFLFLSFFFPFSFRFFNFPFVSAASIYIHGLLPQFELNFRDPPCSLGSAGSKN